MSDAPDLRKAYSWGDRNRPVLFSVRPICFSRQKKEEMLHEKL